MKYNFTDTLIEAYTPLCEKAEATIVPKAYESAIKYSDFTEFATLDNLLEPKLTDIVKDKATNTERQITPSEYKAKKANYDLRVAALNKIKSLNLKGYRIDSINFTKLVALLDHTKKLSFTATDKKRINEFFLLKIAADTLYSKTISNVGLTRLASFLNAEISETIVETALTGDYTAARLETNKGIARDSVTTKIKDMILADDQLTNENSTIEYAASDIQVSGGSLSKTINLEVKVISNSSWAISNALQRGHKSDIIVAYIIGEGWASFVRVRPVKQADSNNDVVNIDDSNIPSTYTKVADVDKIIADNDLLTLARYLQTTLNENTKIPEIAFACREGIYLAKDKSANPFSNSEDDDDVED